MLRTFNTSVFAFAMLVAANEAMARDPPAALEDAAVYIKVERVGPDNKPAGGFGSGFCIFPDRHVVPGENRTAYTNRVVDSTGRPSECSGPAEVVPVHPDRDLTLLKCGAERQPALLPLRAVLATPPDRQYENCQTKPPLTFVSVSTRIPSSATAAGKQERRTCHVDYDNTNPRE